MSKLLLAVLLVGFLLIGMSALLKPHESVAVEVMIERLKNSSERLTGLQWNGSKINASLLERQPADAVFYRNITGRLTGDWQLVSQSVEVPLLVDAPPINASVMAANVGSLQLEGRNRLRLDLISNDTESQLSLVEGLLTLFDSHHMAFQSHTIGVHYVAQGILLMRTSGSAKALQDLPGMALSQSAFNETVTMLQTLLNETVVGLQKELANGVAEQQFPIINNDCSCSFWIVAQLQRVSASVEQMEALERELKLNEGMSVISEPPLLSNITLVSPDCGLVLKSIDASEQLLSVLYRDIRSALLLAFLLALANLFATVGQLRYSQSQSARQKLSLLTLGIVMIVDAMQCIMLLGLVFIYRELLLVLSAVGFINGLLCINLASQYIPLVASSRRDHVFTRYMASATNLSLLIFNIGFAFLLLLWCLVAVAPILVSKLLTLIISLVWVPQIVSNIMRNTRNAFKPEFVAIRSLSLVAMFFYLWQYPKGILQSDKAYPAFSAFVSICIITQTVVLLVQDKLGPRCFLPQSFFPPTYNYHSINVISDVENPTWTNRQGLEGQSSLGNDECAICFQSLNLTNMLSLNPLEYMVTPCYHIYHSECLERWMDHKLECPVCRSGLPAI